MIDRDIQISISERSSGWATNYVIPIFRQISTQRAGEGGVREQLNPREEVLVVTSPSARHQLRWCRYSFSLLEVYIGIVIYIIYSYILVQV